MIHKRLTRTGRAAAHQVFGHLQRPVNAVSNAHGWFQTFTGRRFVPELPCAQEIDIEDIAHALSNLCRFGGHCREFYSVAQHSVLVSQHVPAEHRFAALMHDATEAYLGDVIQPVKRLLPEYFNMETEVWRAICDAFPRLPHRLPECVKEADRRALMTERRDVMNRSREPWSWGVFENYEPFAEEINPLPHEMAREMFLARFTSLTK